MADNVKLIEDTVKAVATLIDKQTTQQMPDHEKQLMGNCLILLGGALIDLNRIANAIEALAQPAMFDRADPYRQGKGQGGGRK